MNINPYLKAASLGWLLGVAGVAGPGEAGAHEPVEKTLSVTGTASATAAPDRVSVRFGVEVQGETAAAALSTNSGFMEQVIDAIRRTGVEDSEISTSQFNIYPVYERQTDRQSGAQTQVLAGYRVSNMLSVDTARLDRVAGIIDAAVEAGVNRIDQVAFSLSPEVRDRMREELIEAAVLNARDKAGQALAPLGHVVTGVRQVALTEFSPPPPVYATARMEMASSAPTQVFASDQDVQTTVNVTFLISPE